MSVIVFLILLIIFPPFAFIWLLLRLFIALGRIGKK
jgi:hypothetical protein